MTGPNLQALSQASAGQAGAARQLSPRQIQLLQLLADGKDLKDAAMLMGIAYNSARNYSVNIHERLDAETTVHAVAIGIRNGIIS